MQPTFWQHAVKPIARLASREMKRFAQEHPKDKVIRFVLELDATEGQAVVSLDVEGGAGGWSTKEYRHPSFATLHDKPEWAPLVESLRKDGPPARAGVPRRRHDRAPHAPLRGDHR